MTRRETRPSRRKLTRRQREARDSAQILAELDQLLAGCRAGDDDALAEAWSWIETSVSMAGRTARRHNADRVPGKRFVVSLLIGLRRFAVAELKGATRK